MQIKAIPLLQHNTNYKDIFWLPVTVSYVVIPSVEEMADTATATVFTFYKDVQNELDNHFSKALSSPADNAAASGHSTTSLLSSKL